MINFHKKAIYSNPSTISRAIRTIALAFLVGMFVPPAFAAVNIPITVNVSETVTVTGTPRIAVDVGGSTRYATYTSGTGTNALTFTLAPQAGDVDLDGVTVSSPIDLNGGTIKDAKGNNAVLTFTPPSTSNVKVNYPSLSLDFIYDADGRYTLNGTAYNDLSSFLTAASGSFTRASIGTYYDSTGTLQTATANTPRFDYDPVTHTPKGILIEESRTNLAKYTSQFDTGWSKTNISISPNTLTAPDGSMTADKIVENTTVGVSHFITQNTGTGIISSPYTISAYLKAGERSKGAITFVGYTNWQGGTPEITFDLATGTIVTTGTTTRSSIKDVGNGWYYITLSSVMTTAAAVTPAFVLRDTSNNSTYTGDGTSGYYIWGVQVEQGSFPTSYIPTTITTVTRGADVFSAPIPIPSAEGSLFARGVTNYIPGTDAKPLASVDDNTANNALQLRIVHNSGGLGYGTVISGAAAGHNISTYSASSVAKISLGFKTNSTNAATNGTLDSLNNSISIPTLSKLRIGGSNISNSKMNGWVEKVSLYPARVSDTQLQLLTQ